MIINHDTTATHIEHYLSLVKSQEAYLDLSLSRFLHDWKPKFDKDILFHTSQLLISIISCVCIDIVVCTVQQRTLQPWLKPPKRRAYKWMYECTRAGWKSPLLLMSVLLMSYVSWTEVVVDLWNDQFISNIYFIDLNSKRCWVSSLLKDAQPEDGSTISPRFL